MEILIIIILSACIFAYTLIKWSFTEDKKPKGYKEEGTLEITSGEYEGTCGSCKHYLYGKCLVAAVSNPKFASEKCNVIGKDGYKYEEIH